jgi:MFS family permease
LHPVSRVLASLIVVAAVANLNLSVAIVAIPDIGKDFDSSQTMLNLIAVGYSLSLAASVLWFGAIGDRYGRKLLGMAFSIPISLLAAFACRAVPRPGPRRARRRHCIPDDAGADHREGDPLRALRARPQR